MTKEKRSKKTKRTFIGPVNYDYELHQDAEQIKGESMTVPGEALSVKEILEMHTKGLTLPSRSMQYDGTDDEIDKMPETDITRDPDFDLADATMMKDTLEEELENKKQQKREEAKQKAREAKAKAKEKSDEGAEPSKSDSPQPQGDGEQE